jgi:hypothetical protein
MSKNKILRLRKFTLRVSRNEKIAGGYYHEVRAVGILPNCHKARTLSFTPMSGYVWTKALFDHDGEARISPKVWRELVQRAPVESCTLFPVTITAELEALARADAMRTADAAERQLNDREWTCDAHRQACATGEIYSRVILETVQRETVRGDVHALAVAV